MSELLKDMLPHRHWLWKSRRETADNNIKARIRGSEDGLVAGKFDDCYWNFNELAKTLRVYYNDAASIALIIKSELEESPDQRQWMLAEAMMMRLEGCGERPFEPHSLIQKSEDGKLFVRKEHFKLPDEELAMTPEESEIQFHPRLDQRPRFLR